MKKIKRRYQVESCKILLSTPSLLEALIEFFKTMKKGQECTLRLFFVDKEILEKKLDQLRKKEKNNGKK